MIELNANEAREVNRILGFEVPWGLNDKFRVD